MPSAPQARETLAGGRTGSSSFGSFGGHCSDAPGVYLARLFPLRKGTGGGSMLSSLDKQLSVGVAVKITLLLVVALFASQSSVRSDEVYGGIGVEAEWFKDPSGWEIHQIYPHSPAERAGLYRFQQILSIDGQATAGKKTEACKGLVRGKIGSSVELVLVDPLLHQTNTVTLVREAIEILDISRDPVVKAPGYLNANLLNLIDGQKSFTR